MTRHVVHGLTERLADAAIVICAGSGGVGKTTTAAAIGVGLAARGARVAVVTIDPARRLADALGIAELGNDPTPVDPARLTAAGVELRGELWAMTLDPKRTFDDLIERLSPDAHTRDEILENRIYRQVSGTVAGLQEFSAVAKLHELHVSGRFDVVVLDTPPSRNALDFLESPARLTGFFEGRALKAFLLPTGLAARTFGRGTGLLLGALRRITGVELLDDLGVFFRALGGLVDGLRERADVVAGLLTDPGTRFLIVTSTEREPAEEAMFFREQLAAAGMPFGGLIINRVLEPGGPAAGVGAASDAIAPDLEPALGARLAGKVARAYGEALALMERDAQAIERLAQRTGDLHPVIVPELEGGVDGVDALAAVYARLFAV
ncbi:unannotated protein [freshwater metagenome]|uniref:Unannotated protein n=1 Tax=freshwater metagenome TaxID=449393 RepID=A0A6J7IVL1_9ZZZZ